MQSFENYHSVTLHESVHSSGNVINSLLDSGAALRQLGDLTGARSQLGGVLLLGVCLLSALTGF